MRIRAHEVAAYVADLHNIPMRGFYGVRRTVAVARPRQIAMYCIRTLCPHMSLPRIGLMMGNRDHTTILHGVRKIEALIETDAEIADTVDRVLYRFIRTTNPASEPIEGAIAWQALCQNYGQAMRAAA